MAKKAVIDQKVARRRPQQERARHKIELIFEATIRLLERTDIASLTTNAIAETAGVSIGTLYQYFDDRQAILDALADREMAALSGRVIAALQGPPPDTAGGRVPLIMNAVLKTYGGRRRAHRLLMEHALARGPGTRLVPLYRMLGDVLTSGPGRDSAQGAVSAAEAFVLTHAFVGVMRGALFSAAAPPRAEIEAAMTRLMAGFGAEKGTSPDERACDSRARDVTRGRTGSKDEGGRRRKQ